MKLVTMAALLVACSGSQPIEPAEKAVNGPVNEVHEETAVPATAMTPLELPNEHVVVEITARGGRPLIVPPGEPMPSYGPRVITTIRWDGQAEWSDDHRRGGEPLHTGTVDVARLRAWVDTLRTDGTFEDPALNRTNLGPDARYVHIAIDLGAQTLRMSSWHEVEDSSLTIATAAGLQGLKGRDPAEVMAAQPPDYRDFIERWTAIRAAVDGLLPANK